MIEWLLKELEKNPTGVFRKRDLLEQSKVQFEELKSLGLLIYVQPNLNCETYPCSLPCANSCPMDVVEMDSRLYAICPQDSEIDPISLNRDELDKYQFCIEKFLELVRSANKLAGSLHEIKQDYFYFGYITYKNNRVGFVFGSTITCKSTLELTGLKCLCADDDYLVIFSPVSVIEDISHRKELSSEKIVQTSFASSLNFQTFQFSVDKLVSGIFEHRAETEQKGQSVKEPSKEAKNVFKKTGDFWTVKFQGNTASIKDSKGMLYIARLLEKPHQPISALKLATQKNDTKLMNQGKVVEKKSIIEDSGKSQDLVDKDYLTDCKQRLDEIEEELRKAEKNNDPAEKDRLERERGQIRDLLKPALNLSGKSRSFSDNVQKTRVAVTMAIIRALKNINEHHPSLYRHLDNSIQRGTDFAYQPEKKISWQL